MIGPLKAEPRRGRTYLAPSAGDAINAVLAAVGYNCRLLIRWLAVWSALLAICRETAESRSSRLQPA